jgi:hypothetical protein
MANTFRIQVITLVVGTVMACGADAAKWLYKNDVDPMTGKPSQEAGAISDNEHKMNFPYNGKNSSTLWIRRKSAAAPSVMFTIDRGQFVCDECTIRVRFDDDEPANFSMSRSSDRDPRIMFFVASERFIDNAVSAKRIRVEFTAFREGIRVADFKFGRPLEFVYAAD